MQASLIDLWIGQKLTKETLIFLKIYHHLLIFHLISVHLCPVITDYSKGSVTAAYESSLEEQNEIPSSSLFAWSQPLRAPLTGSLHYSAATPCCPGKKNKNDEPFPAAVSCRGTDPLDPAYFKVLKKSGSMTGGHRLQKNAFKT